MSFQRPGSRSKAAFGVAFRGATSADGDGPSTSGRMPAAAPDPHAARMRGALPVARYQRQLMYLVETHATVVIVGATGCGKTTQVPQYLHEAGWTSQGFQVWGGVSGGTLGCLRPAQPCPCRQNAVCER